MQGPVDLVQQQGPVDLIQVHHGFDLVQKQRPVDLEVVGSQNLQLQIHYCFDVVQDWRVAVGASLFGLSEVMLHCRINQRSYQMSILTQ